MLYEFLKWLSNDYSMLNIFNYLSLRAVYLLLQRYQFHLYLAVGILKN